MTEIIAGTPTIFPELGSWNTRPLLTFDLETTGTNATEDRIVTWSLQLIRPDHTYAERYGYIVNPGIDIPDGAAAVHGVSTADAAKHGLRPQQAVQDIVDLMRLLTPAAGALVVFNAPFDITMLHAEAARHDVDMTNVPVLNRIFDPLVVDKQLDKWRKGKRTLEAMSAHYGLDAFDAHDAGADSFAAAILAYKMAERYSALTEVSIEDLHAQQSKWALEQRRDFAQYLKRQGALERPLETGWPIYDGEIA